MASTREQIPQSFSSMKTSTDSDPRCAMNATATYLRLISMDVTSVDPRQHRHLRTHELTAMITPLAARTGGPLPGKAEQLMSGEGPDKSSSQLRNRHPELPTEA